MIRLTRLWTCAALVLLLCQAVASGQTTPGTVCYPTCLDTPDTLFRVADKAQAVLMSSLSSSATSAYVSSTSGFPSTGSITIDNEIIFYTSKTGDTFLGLIRGAAGTTAANHASSAAVKSPILAVHHNTLVTAMIRGQTKLGTGSSTPSLGMFLKGLGPGESGWDPLSSNDIPATLSGKTLPSATLTSPTITGGTISSPTIASPTVTGTLTGQSATFSGTINGTHTGDGSALTGITPTMPSSPTFGGTVTAGSVATNTLAPPSGTVSVTGNLSASGTIGGTFVGNCAGCTGITGGTGGVSNTGSTTVGADTDANGVGVIDLQTQNQTRLRIENNGDLSAFAPLGLKTYLTSELPPPGTPGRMVLVSDNLPGIRVDTGTDWIRLAGDLVDLRWFGASGARTSAVIPSWWTKTVGTAAAGATTVTVTDATSINALSSIKLVDAGSGAGLWRGLVVSKAGNVLTLSQPLLSAVTAVLVLPGDNNVWTDTTASASAGATTLTVRSSATYRAGHGVYISNSGAASGGGRLPEIRVVASVPDATHIVLTSGITNAIPANTYIMHDESAAVARAIAAVASLGSGTIYLSEGRDAVSDYGTYMVNGAKQGTQNSIVRLPSTSFANPVSIRFLGSPRSISPFNAFQLNHAIGSTGSILQSDCSACSIIGGDGPEYSGFTGVSFYVEHLIVRSTPNPKGYAINAGLLTFFNMHDAYVDTAVQAAGMPLPTDTNNYAIYPPVGGNGGETSIGRVWVHGGYRNGVALNEHVTVDGTINSFGNYNGVEMGGGNIIHPAHIGHLVLSENHIPIAGVGRMDFTADLITIEHREPSMSIASWTAPGVDVYDPDSLLYGEAAVSVKEGLTGTIKILTKTGGLNFDAHSTSGKVVNFGVPFVDSFNDNQTGTQRWRVGSQLHDSGGEDAGTVVEQSGRVEITPPASVADARKLGYVMADALDFTGLAATAEVTQVASGNAATYLVVAHNNDNLYAMYAQGGRLYFVRKADGAATILDAGITTTYNATSQACWRIKEADNVVYEQVAPLPCTSTTWTTISSEGVYFRGFSSVRASIEAGVDGSVATPGKAIINYFSIGAP